MNYSISSIDKTVTGTISPGQSTARSNCNGKVLNIPENFKTGAYSSNGLVSYTGHSLGLGFAFMQKSNRRIQKPKLTEQS